MSLSKTTFLVTAIGSMAAPAVLHSLRACASNRVIGCNKFPAKWTAASKLCDVFYQVPDALAQGYIESIADICQKEDVDYVLPLTDPEVAALNTDRSKFASAVSSVLCIPSAAALDIAPDKFRVSQTFAMDPTINVIPTWDLDEFNQMDTRFPLIIKPRRGRSSEGVFRIYDPIDLDYCIQKFHGCDYIIQPLMSGDIFVADIVRQHSTGRSVCVVRQELLRSVNGAGMTVQLHPDSEIAQSAQHVATRLGINGCVNLEFLVNNGTPFLMDVNPRFSAGIAFTRLSGYDMVKNHVNCFRDIGIERAHGARDGVFARQYIELFMGL